MKTVTSLDIKQNILKILEMLQYGEDILIQREQNQENIAVILSYQHFRQMQQRPLGILKGKARYLIREDFALSDEELVMGS